MTRARPARAITGPATAQVVVPDMKLPPMTPTPWRVKMTPARVMSNPAATSRILVVMDIPAPPGAAGTVTGLAPRTVPYKDL